MIVSIYLEGSTHLSISGFIFSRHSLLQITYKRVTYWLRTVPIISAFNHASESYVRMLLYLEI